MYVALQFKLHIDNSSKQKLLELMRKQSSAIRSAYTKPSKQAKLGEESQRKEFQLPS